jgi:hypothetical protein
MSLTVEIDSKEKSLAALMMNILKAPLKPIEDSVAGLKAGVLDSQDLISEINDTLNASVDQAEKAAKPLMQSLRKLREEDHPALIATLQAYISCQADALDNKNTASLEAKSALIIDEVRLMATDISRQIAGQQSILHILSSTLSEHVERTAKGHVELQQSMAGVFQSLDQTVQSSHIDQSAASRAALADIRLNRELSNRASTLLTGKVDSLQEVLGGCVKEGSVQTQAALADHLSQQRALIETFKIDQQSLIASIDQHHEVLHAEVKSTRTQLNFLTITTGVLLAAILAYSGFEVFSRFS